MAGLSAVVPFLPLFVRELGVSSQEEAIKWSGLVFAAPFFVTIFITPLWGALGDKYGKRVMVIRAVIGLGIAQILMSFAQNVEQLFVFRILQGALSGFYPAAISLIATHTPEEKQGFALGSFQSSNTSGSIIGPVLGGLLSVMLGYRLVFVASGILSLIMGIVLYFYLIEENKTVLKEKLAYFSNWKIALNTKILFIMLSLVFLASFGVAFIRPLFVFYIETMISDPDMLPGMTGILYSLIGIFSALSSFWLGKRIDSHGTRSVLISGIVITGLAYMAHFFIDNIILLVPVRIVLGLGFGVIMPALFTEISLNSPSDKKGGIMGIASSAQTLGNLIAPLLSGMAAAMYGIRFAFIIAGVVFLLMLPFLRMNYSNNK